MAEAFSPFENDWRPRGNVADTSDAEVDLTAVLWFLK